MIYPALLSHQSQLSKLQKNLHLSYFTLKPPVKGLVFIHNQEIKGFLLYFCCKENVELLSLGVKKEDQRKKIASQLMNHFCRILCEDKNIENIYLEVSLYNQGAIYFYTQQGFKKIGLRPHYYGPDHPAYCYQKKLK